jgi:hypothetical protein
MNYLKENEQLTSEKRYMNFFNVKYYQMVKKAHRLSHAKKS